ncbi:MAG: hypothetical protein ACXVCO_01470 [Ktedonobacterales bacterium]
MGKYLGAVISLVVAAAVALLIISALGTYSHPLPEASASNQGTANTPLGPMKKVSLTLQTFPFDPYEDPAWIDANVKGKTLNGEPYPAAEGDNPDWVKYWPTTNLVVPAHALVTITIENYDGVTPLLNPFYARVQGTADGKATVDGQPITQVDPANVSHTFTIHSIPNAEQPWLYVSVPVTGVPDTAPADDAGMPNKPVVTQFSFITGAPGHYIWQCFDPCGAGFNGFGGPMSTKGYMSGTLTVQ